MKPIELQDKWLAEGIAFAQKVNPHFELPLDEARKIWFDGPPEDPRSRYANDILERLNDANIQGMVPQFRRDFTPAFLPLKQFYVEHGEYITNITPIGAYDYVVAVGHGDDMVLTYLVKEGTPVELEGSIETIGRARKGTVIAYVEEQVIVILDRWGGSIIRELSLPFHRQSLSQQKNDRRDNVYAVTPLNDGSGVVLRSDYGIHLIRENDVIQLVPLEENPGDELLNGVDFDHYDISHNNRYICAASLNQEHRLFDLNGNLIAKIGSQGPYPTTCFFSSNDDKLFISFSHFGRGKSIMVDVRKPESISIDTFCRRPSGHFTWIDQEIAFYSGFNLGHEVIYGDSLGYLRSYSFTGRLNWIYYIGGKITCIVASADKKKLWVANSHGLVLQLALYQGKGPTVIGTGNHREDYRLLFWKDYSTVLCW